MKLTSMVIDEGHSIARAAKKLNLKSSTAKLIMKRYRETGTFYQKRDSNTSIKEEKNPQKREI